MTYEEKIKAAAKRHGWECFNDHERGGIVLINDDAVEVFHRLGGNAERQHDERELALEHVDAGNATEADEIRAQAGRWVNIGAGVEWLPWQGEGAKGIVDPRIARH